MTAAKNNGIIKDFHVMGAGDDLELIMGHDKGVDGFRFEIWDIQEHKRAFMNLPEELYDMLALIGAKSRYVIKRVFPKEGHKNKPPSGDFIESLSYP